MQVHKMRNRVLISLLVVVPIIAFVIPIEIPYNLTSNGFIYPKKEWIISKNSNGGYDSQILDHYSGIVTENYSINFERGDLSTININTSKLNSYIKQGDTVGYIDSRNIRDRIRQLEANKKIEFANLQNSSTGEKPALVNFAINELKLAEEQLEISQKLYSRQKELFEKKFISSQEIDNVAGSYELSRIRYQIAKNKLEDVTTGLKDETIQLIQSRINAIDSELDFLNEQLSKHILLAPFSGLIVQTIVPKLTGIYQDKSQLEILLSMYDNNELIVKFPIKYESKEYVNNDCEVLLKFPNSHKSYSAKIYKINNKTELLGADAVVFAYAKLEGSLLGIESGAPTSCKIHCDNLTLAEHFKRIFKLNI